MNTGEILKACREKRDLSLSDLAYKCDSTWSRINYLEKRPDCKVSTLDMLLHELGYEIDIMPVERLEAVESAPTVEIVRCKECAYVKELADPLENTPYLICHKYYHAIDGDDYCSYGVKTERSE